MYAARMQASCHVALNLPPPPPHPATSPPAVVDSPEAEADPTKALEQTGLWGVPTDPSGAMFGGYDFVQKGRAPVALPPVTRAVMERLQDLFDRGEQPGCCTNC